ncbi:DUF1648 domain-containing protein [Streptomyces sp. NPDC045431]|uniref:DUF1648 domain-containing protein n=1 Tax=Streptomyces sp. NPDC045431 TaxID=3155613 RepID=UPI00340EBF6C
MHERDGRRERRFGAGRGLVAWSAGILALLSAMPLAASGRLPDRLATHWSEAGRPDGSMPVWATAVFPACVWAVLVLGVVLVRKRTKDRGWVGATLLSAGVFLVGGQASVVGANLDRTDWHRAGSLTVWVVATLVATFTAGLMAWLASRHRATVVAEDFTPATTHRTDTSDRRGA